jgi:hypothetical protein
MHVIAVVHATLKAAIAASVYTILKSYQTKNNNKAKYIKA